MKAHGNGNPETCASNLLNIVRGEVPFDRVRGRDGALEFRPNADDDVKTDAEWLLATYEPRLNVDRIETIVEDELGSYSTVAHVERKEGEE